jgi:hypothetical protein
VISGHFAPNKEDNNETWALAVRARNAANKGGSGDFYVSASNDATLRVWDI